MEPGFAGWGRPLYERVLDAVCPVADGPLLDVGCGAGALCRLAVDRGYPVCGVDSDPAALVGARRLVPEAELLVGALPRLPIPDRSVAAVTCVQVLMHLPNPLAGLRELARVARARAPVAVTIWGSVDECAVGVFGRALAPLLGAPAPVPGAAPSGSAWAERLPTARAPAPPPLHATGRLAKLAGLARLDVEAAEDVRCAFDFPDEPSLLAGLYASELGRRAVARAGRAPVRRALLAGLAPYRGRDGGYRLPNTFRLLVARAR